MRHTIGLLVFGLVIPTCTLAVGMLYGKYMTLDGLPDLDACAREANVYRCEWVAVPVKPALLPPPAGV